jgi:hypothetical protein
LRASLPRVRIDHILDMFLKFIGPVQGQIIGGTVMKIEVFIIETICQQKILLPYYTDY